MFQTQFLDLPWLQSANGTVVLPGSKSISNRVLLLAALSQGTTTVHDLLDSDDTQVMLKALEQLGCQPHKVGNTVSIKGLGGKLQPNTPALEIFLGNAGTAMRPLTAALSLLGGHFTLTGVPRMYERPIGDLVDALRQIGCQIKCLGQESYPPLQISPASIEIKQAIQVRGDVSSQFLTALLLALPLVATQDIVIEVVGELISKPYIEITLKLLARFGIHVQRPSDGNTWRQFTIPAGSQYQSPGQVYVEADASSASYFIALGAIASVANHQSIRIEGVGSESIQGDIAFVEAARLMGANVTAHPNHLEVCRGSWPLKAITLDCNHIPDAAMTLAMMALYADGATRLNNIASWRVKETDRIAAMASELRKLGAIVTEGHDFIEVTAPATQHWKAASIHTYDDHRMAMCFSLASFNPAGKTIRIEDPKCVAKTFPDYFENLFSVALTQASHIPVICIDGPSSSGKGTLASAVAEKLGYHYLDSGSIYRVLGYAAVQAGLELIPENEAAIALIAGDLKLDFEQDRVLLNGQDVSELIRSEQAGINASKVSSLSSVRTALTQVQLNFRKLPGLVADGRDMGTVIFPDAALKVFLTASAETRALRRHKQLIARGVYAILEQLENDLKERDARDTSRSAAPLKPALDAQALDNSELNIQQCVDLVLSWWQQKQAF